MKKQGKKILIGILLISVLIGGVFIYLYLNKDITSKEFYSENQENIIAEDNQAEENIIVVEPPDVNSFNEKASENNKDNEVVLNDKQVDNKNEVKTTENKKEKNTNNNLENKIETPKKEDNKPKEEISNIPKEESKQENITPKPIEKPKEEPVEIPKQDEHTYKYNASIVEKIKNDIKNNESTYMQQYGYNIVVDQSIITQTNQFTYTDIRVKSMIKNKFGTIKIYARDYYLNGNYMYTEAYIL